MTLSPFPAILPLMATLLQVNHLSKTYGLTRVLSDASFSVAEHEHIACIGRNGAGKSTLLRIIAGTEDADNGEVAKMPQLRLGIVEQKDDFIPDETVLAYLERKSAKPEWECAKIAGRFMLKKEKLALPVLALSGGQQMRVKLAAMLLNDPNLLLLDEPTNFLDLNTQILLEAFLKDYNGAWIIVSHDREFLERTCDKTIHVDRGEVRSFDGDVASYLEAEAARIEGAKRYNRKIESQQKHMQEFVDRFRAKASKATQAQERLKRMAKLHKIDIGEALKTARIRIPPIAEKKGTILRLQGLSIGYPDHVVAHDINVEFERGERIAILGENGQGKSTLLKTINSELAPLAGNVRWAHNITIASFAQLVHQSLNSQETVGTYLARMAGGLLQEDVLRMAGSFLFSIDDLAKPCSVLSGGERARLQLAGMLLGKPDVLLLDEPTNHLDMETSEALGHALREWNGTVFFVSHSRTFVNLLATTILEVSDGNVRRYPGTYEEYVWTLRESLGGASSPEERARQLETIENPAATRHEQYQELKKKRQRAAKLEKEMEDYGKEKRALLDEILAKPDEFNKQRNQRIATLDTLIHHTESEWLKLQEELLKLP
ncbi:MAG: ABC-F family ATP-binding cassette domain-containing protein [Patescibacteria group bacterium]